MAAPAKSQKEKLSLSESAKALGLSEVDTERMVKKLMNDIMLSMHRTASPALRAKIQAFFKENNRGHLHDDGVTKIPATLLIGPPGHGKTTAFKIASQRIAKGLGMRYLENGQIDAAIDAGGISENDFVFVSVESAGAVSALDWAGIPAKKTIAAADGSEAQVMTRLAGQRLAAASQAGGATVLLDDFLNAAPNIQDVGLPLTEEKRYGDLDLTRAYIGMTGNMGATDGTNATSPSVALRTRMKIFFIQDTIENFITRIQRNPMYRDEVGDLGICEFLRTNPNLFYSAPDRKQFGGANVPRTWMAFLNSARQEVFAHGGEPALNSALPDVILEANAQLGQEVGAELMAYQRSRLNHANPLARQVIMDDNFNVAEMEKRYGEGHASEQQNFAYQYAECLAAWSVIKIIQDKGDIKEAMERFTKGVVPLTGQLGHALNTLKTRMANQLDELSFENVHGQRDVNLDVRKKMVEIFSANPYTTKTQREDLINTLSNKDKTGNEKTSRVRKKMAS